MRAISYRQVLFLAMMTLPITGHFLLVSPMIERAGKDAWLCILFTFPIGIAFAYAIYRIHKLHESECMIQIMPRLLGRFFGTIGLLLFIAYGFFIIIITLYCMIDFTSLIYLQNAPKYSIATWIYLVVGYGIFTGVEAIARASEPLAMLLPFTGSSAGISSSKYKDFTTLLPVLQYGLSPVLKGVTMTLALYGEIIVFMMFNWQRNESSFRKLLYVFCFIIFFISFTFLGTITASLSIFGVESTISKVYPAYDVLKLVNFGFINRFDVYGVFTLITGGVIRLALWQIALSRAIKAVNKKMNPVWIHSSILMIVFIFTLKVIPNNVIFESNWLMSYYPLTAWISFGLIVCVWIASEVNAKLNQPVQAKN
jgi:spore germination protein KB